MFCSIEDAWGEKNFTDKPLFQQSDKPELFKNLEHFNQENINSVSKENMYNQYMELKEMFENENENEDEYEDENKEVCLAADNHIQKCKHCRLRYLNNDYCFKPKKNNLYQNYNTFDLDRINLIIRSNKDLITIFLFGLLILLLLQLFAK